MRTRGALLGLLLSLAACQGGLFGDDFEVPNLRIEGNEAFDDDDLVGVAERDLRRFVKNDRRLADADDAAYSMEVALREEGYADAEVRLEVEGETLVFHVDEGPHQGVPDVLRGYQ